VPLAPPQLLPEPRIIAYPCRPKPCHPELQRRKLKLKPRLECSLSQFSFKRLVPGAFNVGVMRSTCTALPSFAVPCWVGGGGTSSMAKSAGLVAGYEMRTSC